MRSLQPGLTGVKSACLTFICVTHEDNKFTHHLSSIRLRMVFFEEEEEGNGGQRWRTEELEEVGSDVSCECWNISTTQPQSIEL